MPNLLKERVRATDGVQDANYRNLTVRALMDHVQLKRESEMAINEIDKSAKDALQQTLICGKNLKLITSCH